MFFSPPKSLTDHARELITIQTETALKYFLKKQQRSLFNIITTLAFECGRCSALSFFLENNAFLALIFEKLAPEKRLLAMSMTCELEELNTEGQQKHWGQNTRKKQSLLHLLSEKNPSLLAHLLTQIPNHEEKKGALLLQNNVEERVFFLLAKTNINIAAALLASCDDSAVVELILSPLFISLQQNSRVISTEPFNLKQCAIYYFLPHPVLLEAILDRLSPAIFNACINGENGNNLIILAATFPQSLQSILKRIPKNDCFSIVKHAFKNQLSALLLTDATDCLSQYFTRSQMREIIAHAIEDNADKPLNENKEKNIFISILQEHHYYKEQVDNTELILSSTFINLFFALENESSTKPTLIRKSLLDKQIIHSDIVLSSTILCTHIISLLPKEKRLEALTAPIEAESLLQTRYPGIFISDAHAKEKGLQPIKSIASIGLSNPSFLAFIFACLDEDEHSAMLFHLLEKNNDDALCLHPLSLEKLNAKIESLFPSNISMFGNRLKKPKFDEGRTIESLLKTFNAPMMLA